VIRLASLAQSRGALCINVLRINAPQTSISSCAGSCSARRLTSIRLLRRELQRSPVRAGRLLRRELH
jgi:hypothetical protein